MRNKDTKLAYFVKVTVDEFVVNGPTETNEYFVSFLTTPPTISPFCEAATLFASRFAAEARAKVLESNWSVEEVRFP